MCQVVSSAAASVPRSPEANVPDGASEDPDTTGLRLDKLGEVHDLASTNPTKATRQEDPVASISTLESLVVVVHDVPDKVEVFYFYPNSLASWIGLS
jgi:hypothetical protein